MYSAPLVGEVDPQTCLTNQVLCITWQGSTESFSWIGWGGIAALSFDPEDGSLIGGLVTIQNLRQAGKLAPTPIDVVEEYNRRNFSTEYFAALMLRKEEFKNYQHPFEDALFESLLLHEVGHANGFRHDFSASREGNMKHFSSSVMDYLPFPTAFLVTDIKRRDIARLKAIYGNQPYIGYDGCSDEMEKSGVEVNCVKGDWGKPEFWYASIANSSGKGVFEIVSEYLSGLPTRDYLSIFAKFFSGALTSLSQQYFSREFLCRQYNSQVIQRELKIKYQIELGCT